MRPRAATAWPLARAHSRTVTGSGLADRLGRLGTRFLAFAEVLSVRVPVRRVLARDVEFFGVTVNSTPYMAAMTGTTCCSGSDESIATRSPASCALGSPVTPATIFGLGP